MRRNGDSRAFFWEEFRLQILNPAVQTIVDELEIPTPAARLDGTCPGGSEPKLWLLGNSATLSSYN